MSAKKRNFFDHLHPPQVSRRSLHPLSTFGLGIACLTCLAVQLLTGLTLFLYYVPDQGEAYERILHIATTLRFGGFIRDLHYVTANALIILAVLHLARVFGTGSYKGRWLNWTFGLILLCIILFSNYTGYLLPWDQVAFWAVRVGSNLAAYVPFLGEAFRTFLLGGTEMGPETLLRSFALHAGLLPISLVVFAALHMWRIRKDGGLAAPEGAKRERLPSNPWLYRAEASVALITLLMLLLLAVVMDAPIYERVDPQHPPNPAKAPWYFVGFQEMVSHSATWGGVVAPLAIFLFFLLAPVFDRSESSGGIWFARDRWGPNAVFLLVLTSQLACIAVGLWFRGKYWQWVPPF